MVLVVVTMTISSSVALQTDIGAYLLQGSDAPVVPTREKLAAVSTTSTGETTSSSVPSKMLTQADKLIESPSTIVTAYFKLKSKFDKEKYLGWMRNMLSVQDAMVIFTSDDEMVGIIQSLRQHALNRTVIIPMDLKDVPLVQRYPESFWEEQLQKDPEKKIHRSYNVFWIWLAKSWFVTEAIRINPYNSDMFMWSDIGCFRSPTYNSKEIMKHREVVPKDRILQMAHHPPYTPMYIWWNDKYKQQPFFYHSGSQMVGYKDVWLQYHDEIQKTIEGFIERNMFIGEDQTVLQSTCLRVPTLCAYVPFNQVKDNHYFGLRWVLHNGGEFQYFFPPAGLPAEKDLVPLDKIQRKLEMARKNSGGIKLNFHLA